MRQQSSLARLLASAAVTAILAAGLGGCQTMSDITGSVASKADASPEADPRRAVEVYGERYRANPKDADAALAYGQALRATGQRAQAAAVLEQATIAHPGNKALLAAYGRALADNGNFQQAFDVLARAHSPDNPDWRILSVQGTALDQLGRHDEARRYYASALKIVPGRAVGAVQSRPVLRSFEGFAEGGRRRCARPMAAAGPMRGCGRISAWWSACRAASPRPKASSRPICRRTRRRPMSPI